MPGSTQAVRSVQYSSERFAFQTTATAVGQRSPDHDVLRRGSRAGHSRLDQTSSGAGVDR